MSEKVSIGIVNYDGAKCIVETLESVANLEYDNFDVTVVDNGSADNSVEIITKEFPDVKIRKLSENRGLPFGRNVAIKNSDSDFIFLLDNDVILEPHCLTELMKGMDYSEEIGACHANMIDPNQPDIPQHYNGGYIHFICAFVPKHFKKDGHTINDCYEEFPVVSGGALLIRKSAAQKIALFDEDYFFNWEDGDFTFRLTLSGYKCLNIPRATVYHKNTRGQAKVYWMLRNRWFFILKNYDLKTIVLLTPVFLIFELMQFIFFTVKKLPLVYLKANLDVFKHLKSILRKRRKVMQIKKVKDKEILVSGDIYMRQSLSEKSYLIQSGLYRLMLFALNGYWKIIRKTL